MKLNWFSPLPPAKTDIANYTNRLMLPLQDVADITLWTDQENWDSDLETQVNVQTFRIEDPPWEELNRADMNIYNIGNNSSFHKAIWLLSRLHPGIVILHDFRLQHFFGGFFLGHMKDIEGYCLHMERLYGAQGRRDAENFIACNVTTEEMAERYPLTSLAVENSLGVLVHTRESFNILSAQGQRPVAYSPLPYPVHCSDGKRRDHTKIGGPPFELVVFGFLGANRQLDVIINALADFEHKSDFRLNIYGEIAELHTIENLIRTCDLKEIVHIYGFVAESELDEALSKSHIALNFRYPTMGEASGTQLRLWAHALPSMVSLEGWYATLPEDTVMFVNPRNPIPDIHLHLRAFLGDPKRFAKMGQAGRARLERDHNPLNYARDVVAFVREVLRFRPFATIHSLAERVSPEICRWSSGRLLNHHARIVAGQIYALANGIAKYD